jgi:hypothetical protein
MSAASMSTERGIEDVRQLLGAGDQDHDHGGAWQKASDAIACLRAPFRRRPPPHTPRPPRVPSVPVHRARANRGTAAMAEDRLDDALRLASAALDAERATGAPPSWWSRNILALLAAVDRTGDAIEEDLCDLLLALDEIARTGGDPLVGGTLLHQYVLAYAFAGRDVLTRAGGVRPLPRRRARLTDGPMPAGLSWSPPRAAHSTGCAPTAAGGTATTSAAGMRTTARVPAAPVGIGAGAGARPDVGDVGDAGDSSHTSMPWRAAKWPVT